MSTHGPTMLPRPTPRRPWYAFRPWEVLMAVLVCVVLVVLMANSYVRRQVALIPAAGRATPREVMDEAYADDPMNPNPVPERPPCVPAVAPASP